MVWVQTGFILILVEHKFDSVAAQSFEVIETYNIAHVRWI